MRSRNDNKLTSFQNPVGMLNVKLRIEHGDTKFETIGEVQITTVGYLQLRGMAKLVRGSRR